MVRRLATFTSQHLHNTMTHRVAGFHSLIFAPVLSGLQGNILKLSFFVSDAVAKYVAALTQGKLFQASLIFARKARASDQTLWLGSLHYTQILNYPENNLPRKTAQAYFAAVTVTKKKRFLVLAPGTGCRHFRIPFSLPLPV